MAWIRQQGAKQLRVTFLVSQDKDPDIYDALSGLRYGQMSSFIREAIRAYKRKDQSHVAMMPVTSAQVRSQEQVSHAAPPQPVVDNEPRASTMAEDSEQMAALKSLAEMFS